MKCIHIGHLILLQDETSPIVFQDARINLLVEPKTKEL